MNELNKDILIALMFISGVGSFISGQFIVSALIFGIAVTYSTITNKPAYENSKA